MHVAVPGGLQCDLLLVNHACIVAESMKLMPIQVECYAGFKADETPRRFFWEGAWIEVQDVVDRWYEAGAHPEWPRADYFKVLDAQGSMYLLKHDLESDEWYLGRKW